MKRFLVALGKILLAIVRSPASKPRTPRHWYPKHWHPETPHICYYCGRYDQEEIEITDPPCEGRRRVKF